MIFYAINTLLALLLAYSFFTMSDGWLRYLMVSLFSSFALYQGVMLGIVYFDLLEHGTWYSGWSKAPFTLTMFLLVVYIYEPILIRIQKKCLNLLTKLRKRIQK
jgi:hypothetical protein